MFTLIYHSMLLSKSQSPDSISGLENIRLGACSQTSTIRDFPKSLVDRRGVEPLTLALQRQRSTTELPAHEIRPLEPWSSKSGPPGRTRTADLTLIRRVL